MKLYKSIKSLSVLLFALFFAAATAQAQRETAPAKKDRTTGAEMKAKKPARPSMEDELNLSPDQRAQFKKADEQYKAKSKASKDAKKQDMAQLRDERKRAHKAALNAEQAAKYDEIMARKEAKRADKQHHKHPKKGDKMKKEQRGERPDKGDMKKDKSSGNR